MVKKILIIKLSAIGDVLMAVPSFEVIKKKYPDAKISLLIGNWSKDLIATNPYIDEIISIDENIFWKQKFFPLLNLFFLLKKKKFDIVYVMHWSNLFNFFVFLLGIKERIGFSRLGRGKFLTRKVPFQEGVKPYTVYKYLNLVNDNFQQYSAKISIYLRDDELQFAKDLLKSYKLDSSEKIIGIAPGGGENPKTKMLMKRWPIKYFSELVQKIIFEGHLSVLLFGSNEEVKICNAIEETTGKNILLINLCGKTTLRQTAALLKKCDIVISNDSGLLHLAIAVETKTISIFGPTPPWDKVPLGNEHIYFYKNLSCSPCYKNGKFPKCQTLSCLQTIPADEVFQKVNDLLKIENKS